MSQSSPNHSAAGAGDYPTAETLAALKSYDTGSSRAALCPLDEAVKGALPDPKRRARIEVALLAVLKQKPSAAAIEYICSKFALAGSDACVPALGELLSDPKSAIAARNALEKIPGDAAPAVLRRSLTKLGGVVKIGVIRSLGARADAASVGALTKLLGEPDRGVAVAAAGALGEIGSVKSAKALKQCLAEGKEFLRSAAAGASLVCAERLLAAGRSSDARSLYESLLQSTQPAYVRQAASRGLECCAGVRSHMPGT